VLSSARKYIYPLQHSKHSVVRISIVLLTSGIIAFLVLCGLDLYKFQGTSSFIYDVTKLVPLPVAKVGNRWVGYDSYLFELRRNMHYYATQQQADFSTTTGKVQLVRLKQQAMNQSIQNALVDELADQNHVTVSDQEVNNQVDLLRNENRLGSSDHVFKEVLSQYWGWSESDFKSELSEQLLQQAVVAKLDTNTVNKANTVLKIVNSGGDFATLASQYSDDASTKTNGGQYPSAITINDAQIPPEITNVLFNLKPGQTSGIVNTGFTLEILKVIDSEGSSLHAAHIQFTFQSINTYTQPLQHKEKLHEYIKI
jgi:hypothetical protein